MDNNFSKILDKTLSYEGSGLYKEASGNNSKYGVQQQVYDNYLKQIGRPQQAVNNITPQEVQDLYYKNYYVNHNMQYLPHTIAAATFDFGVNSGPGRSIKLLQNTIGAKPDGVIGPKTIQAVNAYVQNNGESTLLQKLIDQRRSYVDDITKSNPDLISKRTGLLNRVDKFENDWIPKTNGIRNLKK